jgi:3D (Asp-Asp-Asp) domain-containing protein
MLYSVTMKPFIRTILFAWLVALVLGVLLGILFPPRIFIQETPDVHFYTHEVQEVEQRQFISLGEYRITAYCPCEICCGKWAANRPEGVVYGAYGSKLIEGVSVAAPLPEGVEIFVEGVGQFTVQDKLADWVVDKYNYQVIDIYFDNHADAEKFGLHQKEVTILKGVEKL